MMKKDKDSQIFGLFEQIVVMGTISCSKCETEDTVEDDGYDCADFFYDEGWRSTPKNVYCPKCAKKYLKQ